MREFLVARFRGYHCARARGLKYSQISMRFVISRRHLLASCLASRLFAREQHMQLSLSVRVAESFENKEKSSMTIDQLIALAKVNGYSALCMRASQAGVQSPKPLVQEIAGKIRASGLRVSMVTGDF